jgi:uncharacterized DUF497 family protein
MITWDEKKCKKVIKNHGIDFAKIEDIFDDPFAIQQDIREHSASEERLMIIAKTAAYGLVALVYTFRDEDIRYITARRAEKWMTNLYEKQRNRY